MPDVTKGPGRPDRSDTEQIGQPAGASGYGTRRSPGQRGSCPVRDGATAVTLVPVIVR